MLEEVKPKFVADEQRTSVIRIIIASGWLLTIIMSVVILGTSSYLMFNGGELPKTLENWSSIIIGFYFGTFMSLLKDYANAS